MTDYTQAAALNLVIRNASYERLENALLAIVEEAQWNGEVDGSRLYGVENILWHHLTEDPPKQVTEAEVLKAAADAVELECVTGDDDRACDECAAQAKWLRDRAGVA